MSLSCHFELAFLIVRSNLFFEDYGLLSECRLEAMRENINASLLIGNCLKAYLKDTYKITDEIRNGDKLYSIVDSITKKEGIHHFEFIEKACREIVGKIEHHTGTKQSFWDKILPKM